MTRSTEIPSQRYEFSAVVLGSRLYIFGGMNDRDNRHDQKHRAQPSSKAFVGHSRDEDNEAEERTVENAFKGKSVFVYFETAAK